MPTGYEEERQHQIEEVINNYIEKMASVIALAIGATTKTESLEEAYITQTKLIPNDFFDHSNPGESCGSQDILLRNFGEAIIVFNDLKRSTNVIEWLENRNLLCIYAAYMKYSSELLSKVLNLIDGKIVESTGDGNYSIIHNLEVSNFLEFSKYANQFININMNIGTNPVYLNYINVFKDEEIFDIEYIKFPTEKIDMILTLKLQYFRNDLAISFRFLFFLIFAKFNMKINDILDSNGLKELFFTRIGCQIGECKVTRINIDGHIYQDKLIGTIIHRAAHQASGK